MTARINPAEERKMKERFTVYVRGIAKPKGSMRAFKTKGGRPVVVAANKPEMRTWERAIQGVVQQEWQGPPLEGPVCLRLSFCFPLPKSAPKRNPPLWVKVRPDLGKLARLAEDAMTGIVYRDDAQIVLEYLTKSYGEEPGLRITVESLPATAAEERERAAR